MNNKTIVKDTIATLQKDDILIIQFKEHVSVEHARIYLDYVKKIKERNIINQFSMNDKIKTNL